MTDDNSTVEALSTGRSGWGRLTAMITIARRQLLDGRVRRWRVLPALTSGLTMPGATRRTSYVESASQCRVRYRLWSISGPDTRGQPA